MMWQKNIFILLIGQILGFCSVSIVMLTGSIIGYTLTSSYWHATVPAGLFSIGAAVSSLTLSYIFLKFETRKSLQIGSIIGVMGTIAAMEAIYSSSFIRFNLAILILGVFFAYILKIRFLAIEYSPSSKLSIVLAIILFGGTFSALLGPSIAIEFKNFLLETEYVGSFFALGILIFLYLLLLFLLDNKPKNSPTSKSKNIPFNITNFKRQSYLKPVFASMIAYTTMGMIMTAAPLSMHKINGISLELTKSVVLWHSLFLFLPSFFTGFLNKKFGEFNIIFLAIIFFVTAIMASLLNPSFNYYLIAMIFLGIGWNLMFFGGTSLLANSLSIANRNQGQSLSDFISQFSLGLVQLISGPLLYELGWKTLNLINLIPILTLIFVLKKKFQISPPKSNESFLK